MAFMFKPVYVLILSSIFSDVTNLGGRWCNSNQLAPDVKFIQPFSRIFPGADAQSLEETLFNAIVEEIAEDLLSDQDDEDDGNQASRDQNVPISNYGNPFGKYRKYSGKD